MKFQKHFNDMNDKKKSKYFKVYKRHTFVKSKKANKKTVNRLEKEHTIKKNYIKSNINTCKIC
jgi:hypothetical protein